MNSFGSASLQFALIDPRSVRQSRDRFRRGAIPMLDRANSLYVPTGRWPSRGYILLARGDYDQLDSYSTALQLSVGNPARADNVGVLRGLSVVQAQCVTRGLAADEEAIYLVEVTDARGLVRNEWFQFPTVSQYNIRAPAYPQVFHPGSLNGGAAWTWSAMLQNLWQQMPLLGAWPGLPAGVTVSGTPEGFWFSGVPAWASLCDVLDYLGLTVACDLTAANPLTIVSAGAADPAFAALQSKYLTNLEDDQEWIDTGAGRVPKTVAVLFRRRNSVYGTEETVTYGDGGLAKQWDMAAIYSVSVAAPAQFASASGAHYLWSDFSVRYDQNGDPLAADAATASAIAHERVVQYFARVYSQTSGFMTQTYAGALPFKTGPQVDGVCYYQDYGDRSRAGWRTKVVRGACPPFDGIWD